MTDLRQPDTPLLGYSVGSSINWVLKNRFQSAAGLAQLVSVSLDTPGTDDRFQAA
jgi:hypothetical protein